MELEERETGQETQSPKSKTFDLTKVIALPTKRAVRSVGLPSPCCHKRQGFWNRRCLCIFSFVSDDVLVSQVFVFLEPKDLSSVSRTCRRWNFLSHDKSLWKSLDLNSFPPSFSEQDFVRLAMRIGSAVESLTLCESSFSSNALMTSSCFFVNLKRLHFCESLEFNDEVLLSFSDRVDSLEELVLGGCSRLTDSSVAQVLAKHQSLESVSVRGCKKLTSNSLQFLSGSIHEVCLAGCQSITLADTRFPWKFSSIRVLNLHGVRFESSFLDLVTSSAPSLHTLVLSHGNPYSPGYLTDQGLGYLSRLKHLRDVNLMGSSKITDSGLLHLMSMCSEIEKLNLASCSGLSDTSISMIPLKLPSISHLNLYFCPKVQDRSISALSRTGLQFLDIEGCHMLTRECVSDLVRGFVSLRHLNISRCSGIPIDDVDYLRSRRDVEIAFY